MKLIDKILEEALDFKNVKTFKHKERHKEGNNYIVTFLDENNNLIKIEYFLYPKHVVEIYIPMIPSSSIGYHLGLTINGSEFQDFKSDYSYYIRILATVLSEVINFIHEIKPNFLFIVGNSLYSKKNSGQKGMIYSKIISNFSNLLPSNYTYGVQRIGTMVGTLIWGNFNQNEKK